MEAPLIGEKDQCPGCGSREVRPMRRAEYVEFHGRDQFVLTLPRLCKSCGHGWDVRPSKGGGIAMQVVSIVGMIAGSLLLVGGLFLFTYAVLGDKAVTRLGRKLSICFGGGAAILGGSIYTFLKYRRLTDAPPGGPGDDQAADDAE